jgi:hypothetical protein
MLKKNLIVAGGSAMIMKEIADRVRQARIDREKKLRVKKVRALALPLAAPWVRWQEFFSLPGPGKKRVRI